MNKTQTDAAKDLEPSWTSERRARGAPGSVQSQAHPGSVAADGAGLDPAGGPMRIVVWSCRNPCAEV